MLIVYAVKEDFSRDESSFSQGVRLGLISFSFSCIFISCFCFQFALSFPDSIFWVLFSLGFSLVYFVFGSYLGV